MSLGKTVLGMSAVIVLSLTGCVSTEHSQPRNERLTMLLVEGGTFSMGSSDGKTSEQPIHEVTVDSFYMSESETTQKLWLDVMETLPIIDAGTGSDFPVYNVSWNEAVQFCNSLSELSGLPPCYSGSGLSVKCDFSAGGYRLPTETEWEFAAKGGISGGDYLFAGSNDADEAAWYSANSGGITHPVKQLKSNNLGIYDMSGNVWEWCWDWYAPDYYSQSPSENPKGPESGMYRVLRGGSKGINDSGVRVTNRYFGAHRSDNSTGFRIIRSIGNAPRGREQ